MPRNEIIDELNPDALNYEDIDGLLGVDQLPEIPSQQDIVKKVQEDIKAAQDERENEEAGSPLLEEPKSQRPKPKNCFDGGLNAQLPPDHERQIRVGDKQMPWSDFQKIASQTIDPDSLNFLLAKQKIKLDPDPEGPRPVGRNIRGPDYYELEDSVGKVCPFCGQEITSEDASPKEIGTLVYYGKDKDGQPFIWHWAHLSLQMLLSCRANIKEASEKYNVDFVDLKAMKLYYRAIPWGYFGEESHGGMINVKY
jgi:hypothetical protein